MYDSIFAFAIIAICMCTHVVVTTVEIPSYVHVCGRNDLNYNQCIADNILNVKDKLCQGSSELNLSSIEPLLFGRETILNEPNIKFYTSDSKMYGLCNVLINSIHIDPDRRQFNLSLTLKQIDVHTMYEFEVRLLVPITHQGKFIAIADIMELKISLDLEVIKNNGKNRIYASKVITNIKITDYRITFDESEKNLVELHKIFNTILDDNKDIIINTVMPIIEKEISKQVIELFNNITQYNYEEFFPEKVSLETLQ